MTVLVVWPVVSITRENGRSETTVEAPSHKLFDDEKHNDGGDVILDRHCGGQ